MDSFALKVIGFSRVFYEGEALQVQVPLQDGLMGIMAHHENAVLGIVPGTLRLQQPDGEWQTAVVDAGFARISDNTVSILVEEVLRPEEIDEQRERPEGARGNAGRSPACGSAVPAAFADAEKGENHEPILLSQLHGAAEPAAKPDGMPCGPQL